jgi:adenylate kinase
MRLKQHFPFHLIDAMGSLEDTHEAITLELRYQSSLDLSSATYAYLRHLPLSRDIAQHARQQLVSRLEDHAAKHPALFHQVRLRVGGE